MRAEGRSPGGVAFQPVILGADIGVYALARSFHEQYGLRSIVVSLTVTGPVADSTIIENVVLGPEADPEEMVRALGRVAARFTGSADGSPSGGDRPELLLLANTDWLVRFLVQHRDELEQWYTVPFLDEPLLDRLADKARFAELCHELGIATPTTVVQDFAAAASPGWVPVPVELDFPVIAKAANSADYERLSFPGKRKVYQVEDRAGLEELYATLVRAGFTGRFVIQEMIPGDDTQMRSITCYVDTRGVVTLSCCAHVLLEEHTPSGLGNPAAMITGRSDAMLEQAQRLLTSIGYVGFANFDVKVDPRDGSAQFFEVNPRIGRNSYYVTAAGANPVRFLVEDRVDGTAVAPVVVEREVLYSIVPYRLLRRYLVDPALRARADSLVRRRATAHPLRYRPERRWRRRLYVALASVNQVRKFRRHYPRVTESGL
ncbi:ATP-grasp domain-containing protein [Actinotalea sp. BY-33]|uniref:ATP-grasp domain-containing protein n=1 Tax=Actinotalea soli TaxID=2819234 RepID=A0A939RT60_9CELL|nr:ATP-grasp domain-containing protein [Actinotalea soli]